MTCIPHQTAHRSLFPHKPYPCTGMIRWHTSNVMTNRPVGRKMGHWLPIR
jgi:hypothetical protein